MIRIRAIRETLSQVFHSPEASGTWGQKVICEIDEDAVECSEMNTPPYTGVPAPAYLEDDPWFGPAPVRSEKQLDYMEQETKVKQEEAKQNKEPDDIHQVMYDIATASNSTAIHRDPIGGSENFHGGNDGYGWMSGTGMNQFK